MLQNQTIKKLKDISKSSRIDILEMVMRAQEGHIASAYSCIDILTVLYFSVMNINPTNPKWENRDRFILSKGHASTALYSVLARKGFFPIDILKTFGKRGSILGGHPDMKKIPGIDVSSGSLGHGLSLGIGMAIVGKSYSNFKVYVLLGDGECQEGSVWEAAMFASHFKLDNLIVIIDYNKQQAIGKTDNVISLEPFEEKWKTFGWQTMIVDGHNHKELLLILKKTPFRPKFPSLIIAKTVKGKGVSFMEHEIMWHARPPNKEEFKQAIQEIKKCGNN